MSKGRTQNSDSETQFLRSLQETLRDLDKVCQTYTRVLLKPTARLGVFTVEMDTWLTADGKAVGRVYKTDGSFPNAQAKGLAAYLFSVAQEHTLRVEEAIRKESASIMKSVFRGD